MVLSSIVQYQVARADNLLGDVRAGTDRSERLYALAEEILVRALEAKDLKTALAAITSGVNVMREGRAYLELRAEITGELAANKAATQPNLSVPGFEKLMPSGLNVNRVERMMVIAMPKTPEAEAEERRRLVANGLLPPSALAVPGHPQLTASQTFHNNAVVDKDDEQGDQEESDDLP